MNNDYLFHGLRGSLLAFEVLIRRIDAAKLDLPTHPDRFSPREIIAHLADWEPILLQRLEQAKTQPGSEVEAFDEFERAIVNRYSESDVAERLEAFKGARAATVAFLETLTPQDWELSVRHPEQGVRTIEDMASMLIGHDQYHLDQLSEVASG